MKKCYFSFLFLIPSITLVEPVYSQTYDTTQYYGHVNYIFQHVDKTQIATGLLRDYGIDFLNLDNYTGATLHDSNYVSLDEWRMLYGSLYSEQINGNANLLYLDTINNLINSYNHSSDPITFIGLYYNYQSLRSDAITANLMTISNEQLYDVTSRTQSPYQNNELFALAPLRQSALTGANQFIVRSQLLLGNTGKTITSIQVSPYGNGTYQTITLNTPFTVNYDSTGFYNMSFKITYSGGSIKYSHTKIAVYENPFAAAQTARYGERPTTNLNVTATKPYLNVLGQGDITIDLAQSNTTGHIRKPLIVVEGFDPDGSFTYNGQYLTQLDYDVNYGWPFYYSYPITLNSGLDDVNQYDLIYLHYKNGTDYIQRNAYLLEQVIQYVNNVKTTWNGVRQQNVIIGMSMGGLVARYALRDMEINNVDHETRLFISQDAPQWGANVPVGLQAAVEALGPWQIINAGGHFPFIRWTDLFPATVDGLDLLNSHAAKQLLIQHYDLDLPGQFLTPDNGTHNNFMSEINQMGWPQDCKNVALSNGSCSGVPIFPAGSLIATIDGDRSMTYFGAMWKSFVTTLLAPYVPLINGFNSPLFNAWAMTWQFPLSLVSTKSSLDVDFKIRAVPSSGTSEIYRGDIYSHRKILGLINVNNYFIKCHVNSTSDMLPLDNAPGSVYDVKEFGFDTQEIENALPSFFQGYVQSEILQNRFCFVPTVSSLAFANPAQYLFSDICDVVNCQSSSGVSDYYAPQENQMHISYTQDNADWILQEQSLSSNCVKLCSSDISIDGPEAVCDDGPVTYTLLSPLPGAQVTWSASPANIVSLAPNGGSVAVTKVGDGSITLTATVTNACGGALPITKSITVGLPPAVQDIDFFGADPLNLCPNTNWSMSVEPSIYGEYWWVLPNGWDPPTNYAPYIDYDVELDFQTGGLIDSWPPTYVQVQRKNACGLSDPFLKQVAVTDDCSYSSFVISPNPANNTVIITSSNGSNTNYDTKIAKGNIPASQGNYIREVKIYDIKGAVRVDKKYSNSVHVEIDVSKLSTGTYFIRVFDGQHTTSKKLVIQH